MHPAPFTSATAADPASSRIVHTQNPQPDPSNGGKPKFDPDVAMEAGLIKRIGKIIRDLVTGTNAVVVADAAVAPSAASAVAQSLADQGFAVATVAVEAQESQKSLATVSRLYDAMLAAGLDRTCPVVGVGGGLVGDVAGFAAATYMRGLPSVLAPTTLLAMVDAAIGGKTGVNLPLPQGGVGKNMVGAFWPPRLVAIDPEVLTTLPLRELRCGLAECVKHAVIGDPGLLELIEQGLDQILARDTAVLADLVKRSIAVKVAIVARDPTERGERAALNLGHSFGHAIEPVPALGLKHGEAVSIGLCAAMRLAEAEGQFQREDRARVERLLERAGLPVRLPGRMDAGELMRLMEFDKKNAGGRIRLVLPRALGRVEIVSDVPRPRLREAWRAVGAG